MRPSGDFSACHCRVSVLQEDDLSLVSFNSHACVVLFWKRVVCFRVRCSLYVALARSSVGLAAVRKDLDGTLRLRTSSRDDARAEDSAVTDDATRLVSEEASEQSQPAELLQRSPFSADALQHSHRGKVHAASLEYTRVIVSHSLFRHSCWTPTTRATMTTPTLLHKPSPTLPCRKSCSLRRPNMASASAPRSR